MTATPPRRLAHRLSAAFVRTAEPGFYCDGHGLNLRVDPSGARQWVQRLVIRSRPRMLGLGGYPLVSLAEARNAAFANRQRARAETRGPRSATARARPRSRKPPPRCWSSSAPAGAMPSTRGTGRAVCAPMRSRASGRCPCPT